MSDTTQSARSLALNIWLQCKAGNTFDQEEAAKLIDAHYIALRQRLAAVEQGRDEWKQKYIEASDERSRIIEQDHIYKFVAKERDNMEAKLQAMTQERDAAKHLHAELFTRHKARERYMADVLFKHIQHGDEKHKAWLRSAIDEVMTVEGKPHECVDALLNHLQSMTQEIDEHKRWRKKLANDLQSRDATIAELQRDLATANGLATYLAQQAETLAPKEAP